MRPHPAAMLVSAVPTSFDADGELDLAATRAVYEQLAESPLDGVFAAGTTGEFVTLTDDERLDVCSVARDAFGADRTYWHVGGASAHQAGALAQAAVDRGAQVLAAITPHNFAATESALLSGVEGEFVEVVQAGGAGVVSGVSSALPRPFLELRDALRRGDGDAVEIARERTSRALRVTASGNLAHLKAVLQLRGLPAGGLRAPLDGIWADGRRQLEADVADLL